MNNTSSRLIEKRKGFEKINHFNNVQIQNLKPDVALKLYFAKLPEWFLDLHDHIFLMSEEMYKEDYGTFTAIITFLRGNYETALIEETDFVILPLNLNFYGYFERNMLDNIVAEIREEIGQKPLILLSIGDFCPKTIKRASPFEKRNITVDSHVQYIPTWIKPYDIVLNFESSIDFFLHDIAIFPIIGIMPTGGRMKKEFLFSFAGEYYKEGWPEGFIRSPSNKGVWESLKARNIGKALFVTPNEVPLFANNAYYEVPSQSTFTLCPRGIAPWSFRLFESILCGSIPIIMSDSYIKPFPEFIPWDTFSITLPESYLDRVDEYLESIEEHTITALKYNLLKNQHWFTAKGLLNLIIMKLHEKAVTTEPFF